MSGTNWLDAQQQQHWRAYLRGTRLLERALVDDLAPYKMQLTEYELLSMLSESPGQRTRMSHLADDIVQSRSRVTHTAARLEKRGWVERCRASDDGRGVEIVLTDAGRTILDELAGVHVESVRKHLVDVLTPEQFTALGEAMAAVRDRLAPEHHEIGLDDQA
ncbi:MarR family transcriptional regulator [Janibacter cremeus]|uniref:MarR family winged helix-turn-helix transcriptional regulator n=1 Tax=Janibacter cremeus TaxID=1285192 RepID=UPI0023F6C152|nr:MarR family transcriptional regulator [Janibacter cremeus]WEV76689.1 MarR family transcriptional regulator [Janibacter cremeus]